MKKILLFLLVACLGPSLASAQQKYPKQWMKLMKDHNARPQVFAYDTAVCGDTIVLESATLIGHSKRQYKKSTLYIVEDQFGKTWSVQASGDTEQSLLLKQGFLVILGPTYPISSKQSVRKAIVSENSKLCMTYYVH